MDTAAVQTECVLMKLLHSSLYSIHEVWRQSNIFINKLFLYIQDDSSHTLAGGEKYAGETDHQYEQVKDKSQQGGVSSQLCDVPCVYP